MKPHAAFLAASLFILPEAAAGTDIATVVQHYASLAAAVERLASPDTEPRQNYSAFRIEEELAHPSLLWAEVNRGENVLHFQLYNGSRSRAFDEIDLRLFVSDRGISREIIAVDNLTISFGADHTERVSFDPEPYEHAVACINSRRDDGVHVSQLHLLALNKAHPDRVFLAPAHVLIRFHNGDETSSCDEDVEAYAASGTLTPALDARLGPSSVTIEVDFDSDVVAPAISFDPDEFVYLQKLSPMTVDNLHRGSFALDLVNMSASFAKEIVSARLYMPTVSGSDPRTVIERMPLPAGSYGFLVMDAPQQTAAALACVEWGFAGFDGPRFMQRIEYTDGLTITHNELVEGTCVP